MPLPRNQTGVRRKHINKTNPIQSAAGKGDTVKKCFWREEKATTQETRTRSSETAKKGPIVSKEKIVLAKSLGCEATQWI